MISLCSSNSEFIECFWSISGPVSDRAISGLGQSLKLVWNLKEEKISYFITIEMNYLWATVRSEFNSVTPWSSRKPRMLRELHKIRKTEGTLKAKKTMHLTDTREENYLPSVGKTLSGAFFPAFTCFVAPSDHFAAYRCTGGGRLHREKETLLNP